MHIPEKISSSGCDNLLFSKERTGSYLERKKWADWIGKWFFTAFICAFIILGLNAYWLLPLKFAPITSLTHAFFTQTTPGAGIFPDCR